MWEKKIFALVVKKKADNRLQLDWTHPGLKSWLKNNFQKCEVA